MRETRTVLLTLIWLVCASSTAAAVGIVMFGAAHPLSEPGRGKLWLLYAVPYLVVGVSAWAIRRRVGLLAMLLLGTGIAAAYGTLARYTDLQTVLQIMDARAAGRIGMSCGPPLTMFAMALEYGLALIAAAAAMRLLPLRPV